MNRHKLLSICMGFAAAAPLGMAWGAPGPRDIRLEALSAYPMVHGQYSRTYMGDWSRLPTGKELAKKDLSNVAFRNVRGPEAQESFSNLDQCFLTNRALRLTWDTAPDKYGSTAFYVRNCRAVYVDQVYLVQAGPSNTGSHGVFIEDCDTVVVKNSYFAGPLNQVHLRIENCKEVFIDGVEIAGTPDPVHGGFRNGIGIFVEGGQMDGEGKLMRRYSTQARTLEWLLIQNCYIHDFSYGDKWENKDGIQIHSAPNGLLFNTVVENWQMAYADGAFDISHRRPDLSNRVFRIERNVTAGSSLTKSPGKGPPGNALFWVNNIFQDAFHGDYHQAWSNVFRFNTWLYTQPSNNVHYKLWGIDGAAALEHNLVVCPFPIQMVYQNNEKDLDKHRHYHPNRNVYALAAEEAWLGGARREKFSFKQWTDLGKDGESRKVPPSAVAWNPGSPWDYRFTSPDGVRMGAVAGNRGDGRFQVSRDFWGRPRPENPAAGALEPPTK